MRSVTDIEKKICVKCGYIFKAEHYSLLDNMEICAYCNGQLKERESYG